MKGAIITVIVQLVLLALFFGSTAPYDATDNPPERSQMRLHTDHETGCQYLSVRRGGITPRLSATGQHMGCKS